MASVKALSSSKEVEEVVLNPFNSIKTGNEDQASVVEALQAEAKDPSKQGK